MNTLSGIQTWGDATLASIAAALAVFAAAVPKIIGFIVILILGWIVAAILAKIIATVLRSVKFNELADRSGFGAFVRNMGVSTDPAGFIALTTKLFVRLIALVVAFDALGLPAVSDVLRQLLLWIPNLAVGIVVLVIGGLVANTFAGIVRGATSQAGFDNPDLLATVARTAVWFFAIVIAVNQIGVAQELVNTLFMAVVGATALALGLAFGLGGRDTASEVVQNWYRQAQANKDKIEQAATSGTKSVSSSVNEPKPGPRPIR